MKPSFLFSVILLAGASVAQAQSLSAPAASTAAPAPVVSPASAAPAGLYQALGEKAGIARIVADFTNRVVNDPRIKEFFKDAELEPFKDSLAEQICALSGGPCTYEGADMRDVHADMKVGKADFNALVEDLQHAMDAHGIAFSQQNRLLALLAPMHRDIITVR